VGFDVDGVLTDGGVVLSSDGVESKRFHSRDGHAMKLLVRAGLKVSIITGRRSEIVVNRAAELGVVSLYQGVLDKLAAFREILKEWSLDPSECAFAGDDMVDLPILTRVGLPMAPADAASEVLRVAQFVSPSRGGHGAARDMVEFILKGQGRWDAILGPYLA
jgi:3-deoxy-D-manno-octulosonate 8-phosphate phosphatase (KDO 8-P phosphatase)